MTDYKSIQDLIIKAALYDGVTTTIRAEELIGGVDALQITFSKGDRHSTTYIDLADNYKDREEFYLYSCKRALYKLLCGPYEEIEIVKENESC